MGATIIIFPDIIVELETFPVTLGEHLHLASTC